MTGGAECEDQGSDQDRYASSEVGDAADQRKDRDVAKEEAGDDRGRRAAALQRDSSRRHHLRQCQDHYVGVGRDERDRKRGESEQDPVAPLAWRPARAAEMPSVAAWSWLLHVPTSLPAHGMVRLSRFGSPTMSVFVTVPVAGPDEMCGTSGKRVTFGPARAASASKRWRGERHSAVAASRRKRDGTSGHQWHGSDRSSVSEAGRDEQ